MAVISKAEFKDENGVPMDVSPLELGSLVVPISHNKERWVGILLGIAHSELLAHAVQRYVRASDEWSEKKDDHALGQERRLAFIEVLRSISAGCETLASHVEGNYEQTA
jgi:hypothetical protein